MMQVEAGIPCWDFPLYVPRCSAKDGGAPGGVRRPSKIALILTDGRSFVRQRAAKGCAIVIARTWRLKWILGRGLCE
jgi:hypothetical protein